MRPCGHVGQRSAQHTCDGVLTRVPRRTGAGAAAGPAAGGAWRAPRAPRPPRALARLALSRCAYSRCGRARSGWPPPAAWGAVARAWRVAGRTLFALRQRLALAWPWPAENDDELRERALRSQRGPRARESTLSRGGRGRHYTVWTVDYDYASSAPVCLSPVCVISDRRRRTRRTVVYNSPNFSFFCAHKGCGMMGGEQLHGRRGSK
jgi:hypothetical protein